VPVVNTPVGTSQTSPATDSHARNGVSSATRHAPCPASTQLAVTRNLITQGVLADVRPNQKILSAAAGRNAPGSWACPRARREGYGAAETPKGWSETAMSDPVDAAARGVKAGYSIRDAQETVRVRRTIGKSSAASSLTSNNLRFSKSFGDGPENWLKSTGLTPTLVSGRRRAGRSSFLAVNSTHLRTFAPSHLHLSGILRRSSHPSFALANP
jgi:hypothetical protein